MLPLRILEALGATGLRSIRYSTELGDKAGEIICNDISEDAVSSMKRNISHNNCSNITPSISDACVLMYQRKKYFDVVDIDPYGAPVQFLDTAVQCVRSGGLLCVTATDLGVLAGNHIQACYGKYGGMPLRRPYCHEFALRLLLSCVESHANLYSRYIRPLFSYKADFYVRVFVQVIQSQGEVQKTSSKRSYVYDCVGCHSFYLQQLGYHKPGTQQVTPGKGPPVGTNCNECGSQFQIGGPIWSDPIHDISFIQNMAKHVTEGGSYLGTAKRILGMLAVAEKELVDQPLFYELSSLSKRIHSPCPPNVTFRSAILNAGYLVSQSHLHPKSVKTNAPPSFIWDVMRRWCVDNLVKLKEEGSVEGRILRKKSLHEIDFKVHRDAVFSYERDQVLRFAPNPEPNWGPKAKAGKRRISDNNDCDENEKKKMNTGL